MSQTQFFTPLVSLIEELGISVRRPVSEIAVGELVTIRVYNPETDCFDLECGARVTRPVFCDNIWVTVAGLNPPAPYDIGSPLVVFVDNLVDW